MQKGYSLHIGLNKVNTQHYSNLKNLRAAVNDANYMASIAKNHFNYSQIKKLLDEEATTQNVIQAIEEYANNANADDVVLISYSGHGGQLDDPFFSNKNGDEPVDETWCLYDRQLIDDELFDVFRKFKSGVRIVIVSDSCHSGSVSKTMNTENEDKKNQLSLEKKLLQEGYLSKELPLDSSFDIFLNNRDVYKPIQEKFRNISKDAAVKANVQLFAACQDDQIAFDGVEHGRFTTVLKTLIDSKQWNNEVIDSRQFFNQLKEPFTYPTPNFLTYGETKLKTRVFPFSINSKPILAVNTNMQQSFEPAMPQSNISNTKKENHFVSIEFEDQTITSDQIFQLSPGGIQKIQKRDYEDSNVFVTEFNHEKYDSIWALIHKMAFKAEEQNIIVEIEPVTSKNFPVEDDLMRAKAGGDSYDYLPQWFSKNDNNNPPLDWYLDDDHSQLAQARDTTWERLKNEHLENIRIGHIDTGYQMDHPSLMHKNISTELARTFIDNEKENNPTAEDIITGDKYEMQGHGTGTLGILAGGKIDPAHTENVDIGYVGGIPFAEVVPLRTSDTVIIFSNDTFCQALEYAISIGCEVITMSMGGKPSRRMAKVINKAYKKGITIVTAAGNNIIEGSILEKISPKTLIYPAKFPRVIAACGACYNHLPYDFEAQEKFGNLLNDEVGAKGFDIQKMQGNWGNKKSMKYALATYTPNIPWLTTDKKIVKSGGGTSAATPQIAAAAALWIVNNKKGLKERGWYGTWKQVEAVRFALFESADSSFAESEYYYGRGILKAMDAIKKFPIEKIKDDDLKKSPKCRSTLMGLLMVVSMILKKQKSTLSLSVVSITLTLEIQNILFTTPAGIELIDEIDFNEELNATDSERVRQVILNSDEASDTLKAFFA